MNSQRFMRTTILLKTVGSGSFSRWSSALWLITLLVVCGASPATAATSAQQSFDSPQAAFTALAAVWHEGGRAQLLHVLGPGAARLVDSGDGVEDKAARATLAASYDVQHKIEDDGHGTAVLVLGTDDWPYPIPVTQQGRRWRFDVKSGIEQILDRRVGRNELGAIETCRAYVQAQREYAAASGAAGTPGDYALKFRSSPGRRDGLYWEAAAGEPESPLGALAASAEERGYLENSVEGGAPLQGYYFRILTGPPINVPSAAGSAVADSRPERGFALIAYPASYGISGVMTFIVNQQGIVYEKNLGPKTSTLARTMTAYAPDASWSVYSP